MLSFLLRKWVGETLALTPALSPRRGGSTLSFPEFSRPLSVEFPHEIYVGGYDMKQ